MREALLSHARVCTGNNILPYITDLATRTRPPIARNTGRYVIIVAVNPVRLASAMTSLVTGIPTATIKIIPTIR